MNPPSDSEGTIISARWIVPVEPARTVLASHALVVSDERIVAVLPVTEAVARYSSYDRIDLADHVLIPGLVNLHTHAAMTLMRGMADDLTLMDWLKQHIWPAEMRHVCEDFVRDGAQLACAEMLLGGVTCFSDMYFYPQATAAAAITAGMRAAIGLIVIEFPSPYASDAQDYLSKGLALRDTLRGEPLLSFCLAPHAPYTVSDQTLRRVVTYASELDIPIHTHVHETTAEIAQSIEQHGMRPLSRLEGLGLLGPSLIAVHAVHLQAAEIDLLAHHGCHVAHCPSSNLKLASGFAPVRSLINAGVNVGIGSDGAASNNRLDMFSEMRLAALLAKAVSNDATAVPAWEALEMATLRPARALGLESTIGSLATGKFADLVAVRLADVHTSPCYDPVSQLVYAAGREDVSHVWVNGRLVVDNRNLTTLNADAIMARAAFWRNRMAVA
jgi:5-methylthioadenosine/S-adenosylhomocysteine deaminase